MKTFAIGDIHGCFNELMALMHKLPITPEDTVVFLGDYIDRGPDSNLVIAQLMIWKKEHPNWHFLMGNHEHMFIEGYIRHNYEMYFNKLWEYNGGEVTLESYDGIVPVEDIDFMMELERSYEDDKYFFTHAGCLKDHTLEENKQVPLLTSLWIRSESDHNFGKKLIVGHTPNTKDLGQPIIRKNLIGVDGAVCPPANKNLIAIELPSEKFYFQPSLDL